MSEGRCTQTNFKIIILCSFGFSVIHFLKIYLVYFSSLSNFSAMHVCTYIQVAMPLVLHVLEWHIKFPEGNCETHIGST